MNQEIYDDVLQATYRHFAPWNRQVALNEIERVAKQFARPRCPKGTYLPDVALQVGVDCIGLSGNEAMMREFFTLAGTFVRVAVGFEFKGEGGEPDQDCAEVLFFIEGDYTQEKVEAQIRQLGMVSGVEAHYIEPVIGAGALFEAVG